MLVRSDAGLGHMGRGSTLVPSRNPLGICSLDLPRRSTCSHNCLGKVLHLPNMNDRQGAEEPRAKAGGSGAGDGTRAGAAVGGEQCPQADRNWFSSGLPRRCARPERLPQRRSRDLINGRNQPERLSGVLNAAQADLPGKVRLLGTLELGPHVGLVRPHP